MNRFIGLIVEARPINQELDILKRIEYGLVSKKSEWVKIETIEEIPQLRHYLINNTHICWVGEPYFRKNIL